MDRFIILCKALTYYGPEYPLNSSQHKTILLLILQIPYFCYHNYHPILMICTQILSLSIFVIEYTNFLC